MSLKQAKALLETYRNSFSRLNADYRVRAGRDDPPHDARLVSVLEREIGEAESEVGETAGDTDFPVEAKRPAETVPPSQRTPGVPANENDQDPPPAAEDEPEYYQNEYLDEARCKRDELEARLDAAENADLRLMLARANKMIADL